MTTTALENDVMAGEAVEGVSLATRSLEELSCPEGFAAAGLACGLRKSGRRDLSLFVCREGASAAGVFTQNMVRAAPVTLSERHLGMSGGRARAVLINSGMANAATGVEGMRRAERTVEALASAMGCAPVEVLVASTGVIGVQMPADKMVSAYGSLLGAASGDGLGDAAMGILTTDTCAKFAEALISYGGRVARVVGVAKGSGMIHPNMATMLGVVMTDAQVESADLRDMLRDATSRTFNRVSVDGDTSTNDCVFAMASGAAGEFQRDMVAAALEEVCRSLSLQIVRDGEGARRVIHVRATACDSESDARRISETVGSSLLVRTAVAGGDPNWGRILAAVGRSGATLDLDRLEVFAGGERLFWKGGPAETPREVLERVFRSPTVEIEVRTNAGGASAEFFTCDLTEGYVRINADYTT